MALALTLAASKLCQTVSIQPAPSSEFFFILDATSLLYRSYFSKYQLNDYDGKIDKPLLLLGKEFAQLVSRHNPAYVAACFDGRRDDVFRRALFPGYKQNRDAQPAELLALVPRAMTYLRALGCVSFRSPIHEGDDLMGTLSHLACTLSPNVTTILVTEDKDMMCLVSDQGKTFVMHPRTLQIFDEAAVESKMGVPPSLVADLLCLAGDPVDGIPGVKGVGPQTAVRLLRAFGSLDNLYANLDAVAAVPNLRGAKTLAEKLRKQKEDVWIYRSVVALACDVKLELPMLSSPSSSSWVSLEHLRYLGVDEVEGEALMEEAMGAKGVGKGPFLKLLKEQQRPSVPF
ncbi:dna polymerase i [Nannochloropsis oceanica]